MATYGMQELAGLRATMEQAGIIGQNAQPFEGIVPFPFTPRTPDSDDNPGLGYLTIGDTNRAPDVLNVGLRVDRAGATLTQVMFKLSPVPPDSFIPQIHNQEGSRHWGVPQLPSQARGVSLRLHPVRGVGELAAQYGGNSARVRFDIGSMIYVGGHETERARFVVGLATTISDLIIAAKRGAAMTGFAIGLSQLILARGTDGEASDAATASV